MGGVAGVGELVNEYARLVPVFVVALVAPLLVGLMPVRSRVPQVVLLILGGVLVGPVALQLSDPKSVTLLSDLGMGFLFLLAGYELQPHLLREPTGRRAGLAWLTSLVLGAVVVLAVVGTTTPGVIAAGSIALATTALGVLLPVLKDNGTLDSRLGQAVLVLGAFGELGPIVAMAVLLGTRSAGAATAILIAFALIAIAIAVVPSRLGGAWVSEQLERSEHGTGQSTLRLTVLLLVALLALAAWLGFDAVLGAFVGGMVLRRWTRGNAQPLERKLESVGWGVFIPVFFVSSGMALDVQALIDRPLIPVLFLAAMLVVRGGAVLLWMRRDLDRTELVQAALYSTTTLPVLVALTGLAVDDGALPSNVGAAIVGAGVLSVIILPFVAGRLSGRGSEQDFAPDGASGTGCG